MSGWFAVKRGITRHALFKGRPDRLGIWLWLMDNACWQDTPHDINGKTVMIARGSVCTTDRRISEELGVGRQVVRSFLDRLQADNMINQTTNHGRRIVSLCNWDKYQVHQPKTNPSDNPSLTHDQPIKEQGNNSVSKDTGSAAESDPVKVIFDSGIKLLCGAGHTERQARAIIGRWRKQADDGAVIMAISHTVKAGSTDPVSYVQACLGKAKQEAEKPKDGDTRIGPNGEHQVFDGFNGWMRDRF